MDKVILNVQFMFWFNSISSSFTLTLKKRIRNSDTPSLDQQYLRETFSTALKSAQKVFFHKQQVSVRKDRLKFRAIAVFTPSKRMASFPSSSLRDTFLLNKPLIWSQVSLCNGGAVVIFTASAHGLKTAMCLCPPVYLWACWSSNEVWSGLLRQFSCLNLKFCCHASCFAFHFLPLATFSPPPPHLYSSNLSNFVYFVCSVFVFLCLPVPPFHCVFLAFGSLYPALFLVCALFCLCSWISWVLLPALCCFAESGFELSAFLNKAPFLLSYLSACVSAFGSTLFKFRQNKIQLKILFAHRISAL